MKEKIYYRFRMKKDFFDNDKIEYLLTNGFNGESNVLIYIMLLLKVLNTKGKLIQNINGEIIPYSTKKIQRDLKFFDLDQIETFLIEAEKIGLISKDENNILTLNEIEELIGKETIYAEQKRRYRKKTKKIDTAQ